MRQTWTDYGFHRNMCDNGDWTVVNNTLSAYSVKTQGDLYTLFSKNVNNVVEDFTEERETFVLHRQSDISSKEASSTSNDP